MSDSYQAVYDAVRSRIGGCSVDEAIRDALREAFGMAHHHMDGVATEFKSVAWGALRPSVVYRPSLRIDGNQWCALYGDNLQDGVAGFGDSPAAAMDDFDRAWNDKTLAVKSDVFADMGFAAPTFPGVSKEG